MLHETEVKIIDVREEFEFVEGHIPTAINHPLSELRQRFNELNKREHYFVVCFSGGRSAQACEFLSYQGYQVTNIEDGMMEWRGEME